VRCRGKMAHSLKGTDGGASGTAPSRHTTPSKQRLTGTVPTGAQRLEAAVVARAIPGVRAVQDDLRLATTMP
jgi:hypothetical protein